MEKPLIIVESPAKARTLARYLGSRYAVESSIGHVRDLPSSAAEIPKAYKGEPWARLGVKVEDGFKPLYVIPSGKAAQVRKLKKKVKGAKELYLATDMDREGEAIAWHLREVLKPACPVKRMTFEEITRDAVRRALEETREIDLKLVNAQETRRILDRLYGYVVSPLLWKKIRPKLSAGRVQSVAVRLVVERERSRIRFTQAEYWDLLARLRAGAGKGELLEARLVKLGDRRVAAGKDFDDATGKLKAPGKVVRLDEAKARAVAEVLAGTPFRVEQVQETPFTRKPYAPFITSTLQQEAARKLRFSAQRTMALAQHLYENGYITYMRTDAAHLSTEALKAARRQVQALYGPEYLPAKPRVYKGRPKGAQEAHEAIRPAGSTFRTPKEIRGEVEPDAWRLYELIWKRTVACQMKDAEGKRTQVFFGADGGKHGKAVFSASGKVITFPGFLRAYVEGSDDPEAELADQEKLLPRVAEGQVLDPESVKPEGHFTQPPARYTEASLIKELEARGIGRPSTYASILQTIQDRGYVWSKGPALVPTFTAFVVIHLLEQYLLDLVDYAFTARMENGLDAIAQGEMEPEPWLREFYFGERAAGNGRHSMPSRGLKDLVEAGAEKIDAREMSRVVIGRTEDGEEVSVRVGRYGAYVQVGEGERRANLDERIPPDEFTVEKAMRLVEEAGRGDRVLGTDPGTGKPVYLKKGRFGPYVQLGDPELTPKGRIKAGTKPKMASLWPSMSPDTLTLKQALMLLSFPREVGVHPETGEKILAQNGRYGPYLKMGTETRSLPDHESLASVTLEEAKALFKEPKKRRGRKIPSVLKSLGKHSKTGAEIQVRKGRYGPYVTDGQVNATIPKGKDPEAVTLEEAIALLAAKKK